MQQNMLTTYFLGHLKKGTENNEFFNIIAMMMVATIVPIIMQHAKELPTLIINVIKSPYYYSYKFYKFIDNWLNKKYTKRAKVEKINDERNENPLYEAVMWYLMNQVDLDTELSLKYVTDGKFDNFKTHPKYSKRPYQGNLRELKYKSYTISYLLNESKIKFDALEGEVDRINQTIDLSVDVKSTDDKVLDEFIKFCGSEYQKFLETKNLENHVYRNSHGRWDVVCKVSTRELDSIILSLEEKRILTEELDKFMFNRDWYTKRGFQYSLGVLLSGLPGTGKTSIIRYIACKTKRNIHFLRLNQVKTEDDLTNLLGTKNIDLTRTIIVMEDIDCGADFLKSRKSSSKEKEIAPSIIPSFEIKLSPGVGGGGGEREKSSDNNNASLGTFLNILDGLLTTPGQIFVASTNHVEKLDPAFIRPGRFDIKFNFSHTDRKGILDAFNIMYNDIIETPTQEMLDIINNLEENKYVLAYIFNVFREHKNDPLSGLKNIPIRFVIEEPEEL